MTKDEALKMAIETCEFWIGGGDDELEKTINACKEALEQPAQEPLGWIPATYKYNLMSNDDEYPIGMVYHSKRDEDDVAVYTHHHQWQGLTDDEIEAIEERSYTLQVSISDYEFNYIDFARAIEQALKEKNANNT